MVEYASIHKKVLVIADRSVAFASEFTESDFCDGFGPRHATPYCSGRINGHLGVGKCDILGSCLAKTNAYSNVSNPSSTCSLPWQGFKATDQTQKEELILEERGTNTEDLCKNLLQEFAVYLDYLRSLDSDERSRYSCLRKIFRDLFVRDGSDWTILEYLRGNCEASCLAGGRLRREPVLNMKSGAQRQ